ncbi:hypothetical protein ACC810_37770, partial [Rhizobium ruizarguesonis]
TAFEPFAVGVGLVLDVDTILVRQLHLITLILQYLSLDESRRDALKALIAHGNGDADMVKSLCNRRDHPECKMSHKLLSEIPPMPKAGIPMEVFR